MGASTRLAEPVDRPQRGTRPVPARTKAGGGLAQPVIKTAIKMDKAKTGQ